MNILNRVVLVTGASRGLGASIAKEFLKNNDIVYVNYLHSQKEAEELCQAYKKAIPIRGDVKQEDNVKAMIEIIAQEQGKLDIVINNAGIALDTLVEDKTKESFTQVLQTNLIAPFLVCKYARTIMKEGSIVNISSTNGIDTYYPYSLDYDASKAGLISLTKNLAVEYAPHIRVNAVAPGWIKTDMNKNLDTEFIQKECESILLKRFAEPLEIAKVVFFLCSADASYINGTVIRIDGGSRCTN